MQKMTNVMEDMKKDIPSSEEKASVAAINQEVMALRVEVTQLKEEKESLTKAVEEKTQNCGRLENELQQSQFAAQELFRSSGQEKDEIMNMVADDNTDTVSIYILDCRPAQFSRPITHSVMDLYSSPRLYPLQ